MSAAHARHALARCGGKSETTRVPSTGLLAAEAADDLERRYGPLAGLRSLDLGCGPGFYTADSLERGPR